MVTCIILLKWNRSTNTDKEFSQKNCRKSISSEVFIMTLVLLGSQLNGNVTAATVHTTSVSFGTNYHINN